MEETTLKRVKSWELLMGLALVGYLLSNFALLGIYFSLLGRKWIRALIRYLDNQYAL